MQCFLKILCYTCGLEPSIIVIREASFHFLSVEASCLIYPSFYVGECFMWCFEKNTFWRCMFIFPCSIWELLWSPISIQQNFHTVLMPVISLNILSELEASDFIEHSEMLVCGPQSIALPHLLLYLATPNK